MIHRNGQPGLHLFTVFETRVHAEPWFALLLLIFSIGGFQRSLGEGLVDCFAIVVSLLVHEFGHVWAARRDGRRSMVILGGMGAVTISEGDVAGWRGVRMALAGPVFGLALFAILWFALLPPAASAAGLTFEPLAMLFPYDVILRGDYVPDPNLGHYLWARLVQWNLLWGLFNLMPIPPLDGGHVVDHVLEMRMHRARAMRTSAVVGLITAVALVAYLYTVGALALWTVFILGFLALHNWERLARLPRMR